MNAFLQEFSAQSSRDKGSISRLSAQESRDRQHLSEDSTDRHKNRQILVHPGFFQGTEDMEEFCMGLG